MGSAITVSFSGVGPKLLGVLFPEETFRILLPIYLEFSGNKMPKSPPKTEFSGMLAEMEQNGGRIGVVGEVPRCDYRAFSRRLNGGNRTRPTLFGIAGDGESADKWVGGQQQPSVTQTTVVELDRPYRQVSTAAQNDGPLVTDQQAGVKRVAAPTPTEFLQTCQDQISEQAASAVDSPRANIFPVGYLAEELGSDAVREVIIEAGREIKQAGGQSIFYMDRGIESSRVRSYLDLFDALVILHRKETSQGGSLVHKWLIPKAPNRGIRQGVEGPWKEVEEVEDV